MLAERARAGGRLEGVGRARGVCPREKTVGRRLSVLAVLLLVLVAIVWAGVRNLRTRRAAMEANHVQLLPATAAAGDAGAPDAEGANLRGGAAPAFRLTDTTGKQVALSDFKGHPVVVNFWATWCGPCKLEMPWLQEFSAKYKPQGLVVLGLATDEGDSKDEVATEVRSAAKKIGVSYPVLLPDEKTMKAYGGLDYVPETFFVDRGGKVLTITAGAPSKDEMEARIQQTIAAGQ